MSNRFDCVSLSELKIVIAEQASNIIMVFMLYVIVKKHGVFTFLPMLRIKFFLRTRLLK